MTPPQPLLSFRAGSPKGLESNADRQVLPGASAWMARRYLLAAGDFDDAGTATASVRQLVVDACFDEPELGELFLAPDHDGLLAFFRL